MASFRKRAGYWQYIVEIGIDPATGKRKQKTKSGFKTKKTAQLAAAKIEKEVNDGTYVEESDIIFNDFVKTWLDYYSKYVKSATVDIRKTSIKILGGYIGHVMMRKVTKPMYEKILHDLHDREKADNTIKVVHSTANLIFGYASKEKRIIKVSPTENIDFRFLKIGSNKVDDDSSLKDSENFLEKEDLAAFLQISMSRNSRHPQDYVIFLMLAYTGLRRGELSVLKWTDIDLENHTLSVTKTFSYGETKTINDVELVPPKNLESKRVIDIDEFVVIQLKKHRSWQKEYMMQNRKRYKDLNFVFVNTNKYPGYQIAPQTIYDHMDTTLKLMEYPIKLSPHSMRHTHASLCIEAGIPLRDIAERLGHSDIKMLEKIYAHTTKGQKKKTAMKFNQLMTKVREETPF